MRPQRDSVWERAMDSLIVALVMCALILPFVAAYQGIHNRQRVITSMNCLASTGCVLVLVWIRFADGALSRLWTWLPPFWPWGRTLTTPRARWVLVALLIVGTLVGMIAAAGAK